MIEQADTTLSEWIAEQCPGTDVSLALIEDGAPKKATVVCYLMGFASTLPARPLSGGKAAPLQFSARYLVMVLGKDPATEHHLLGDLIAAALDNADFQVDLTDLPAALWQALRLVPRPAFTIQVLLRRERPEPQLRLVRELVLQESPLLTLTGQVVGPRQIPLAGARLELPSMRLSASTDEHGRFTFAAIPAQPLPKVLRILARGRQLDVDPAKLLKSGTPLTITFPITET